MQLKDFICETLINIVEGVNEANQKHKRFLIDGEYLGGRDSHFGNYVDFDIGVSVNEATDSRSQGGGVIAIANAIIGGSKEKGQQQTSENIHHLKFKVFIKKD